MPGATTRHVGKAALARVTAASTSAAVARCTSARTSSVAGVDDLQRHRVAGLSLGSQRRVPADVRLAQLGVELSSRSCDAGR